MISKTMLSKANVLILDDPTNHLDLESITALNEGLTSYKSSIIMTSHDHEFIQTIADHIIEVSDKGSVDRAETTYDEFLNHDAIQEQVSKLY
ncbi:putative ABC transporter ATP-binding protein YkpA [Pediococcus pentosaceus]|nr:putative ABC transporter ATP-binding protein YkpA [Pediococcus pentosaceus]